MKAQYPQSFLRTQDFAQKFTKIRSETCKFYDKNEKLKKDYRDTKNKLLSFKNEPNRIIYNQSPLVVEDLRIQKDKSKTNAQLMLNKSDSHSSFAKGLQTGQPKYEHSNISEHFPIIEHLKRQNLRLKGEVQLLISSTMQKQSLVVRQKHEIEALKKHLNDQYEHNRIKQEKQLKQANDSDVGCSNCRKLEQVIRQLQMQNQKNYSLYLKLQELKRVDVQNSQLKKKISEVQHKSFIEIQKTQELEKQIQNVINQNQKLNKTFRQMQQHLVQKNMNEKHLQFQMSSQEEKIEKLSLKANHLQNKNSQLEQIVHQDQQILQEISFQLNLILHQNTKDHSRLTILNRMAELKQTLDNKAFVITNLQRKIGQSDNNYKILSDSYDQALEKIDRIQQIQTHYKQKIYQQEKQIQILKYKQISPLKIDSSAQIHRLEKEIETLRQSNIALHQGNNAKTAKNIQLSSRLEQAEHYIQNIVKTKMHEQSSQILHLKQKKVELENEIKHLTVYQQKIQMTESERLASHRSSITKDIQHSQRTELLHKIDQYEQALSLLNKQPNVEILKQQFQHQIKIKDNTIIEQSNLIHRLQQANSEVQFEKRKYESNYGQLLVQKNRMQSELQKVKKEKSQSFQHLAEAQNYIQQLINKMQIQSSSSQKIIDDLQNQLIASNSRSPSKLVFEINQLSQKNKEYEVNIHTLQDKVVKLIKQIDENRTAYSYQLKSKESSFESIILQLKQQNQINITSSLNNRKELQNILILKEQNILQLATKYDQIQAHLRKAQEYILISESQKLNLIQNYNKIESQFQALQNENFMLKQTLTKQNFKQNQLIRGQNKLNQRFDQTKRTLEKQIHILKEKNDMLEQQLSYHKTIIRQNKQENQEATIMIDNLKKQIIQSQQQVQQSKLYISEIEAKHKELNSEIQTKQNELNFEKQSKISIINLLQQKKAIENQTQIAKTYLLNLQKEIQKQEMVYNKLSQNIKSMPNQHQSQIMINSEVSQNQKYNKLQAQITNQNRNLIRQNENLSIQRNNLKLLNQNIQQQVSALFDQKLLLIKQNQKLVEQYKLSLVNQQKQKQEIESLKGDIKKNIQTSKILSNELNNMKEISINKTTEVNFNKQKNAWLQKENTELKSEIKLINEDRQNLKQLFQQITHENKEKSNTIHEHTKQILRLTDQINKAETQNEDRLTQIGEKIHAGETTFLKQQNNKLKVKLLQSEILLKDNLDLRLKLQEISSINKALEVKLQEQSKNKFLVTSQYEFLRSKLDEAEQYIFRIEPQYKIVSQERNNYIQINHVLQNDIKNLKLTIQSKQQEIGLLVEKLNEIEKKIKNYQKSPKKQKHDCLKHQIVNNILNENNEKILKLEIQLKQQILRGEILSEEVSHNQTKLLENNTQIMQLNGKVKQNELSMKKLQLTIQKYQKEHQKILLQNKQLENKIKSSNIDAVAQKLLQAEQYINNLTAYIANIEKNNQNSQNNTNNGQLQDTLKQHQAQNLKSINENLQNEELMNLIQAMKNQIHILNQKNSSAEKQSHMQSLLLSQKQKYFQKAQQQKNHFKNKLLEAKEYIAGIEQSTKKEQEQKNMFKDKLFQAETQISRLQQELQKVSDSFIKDQIARNLAKSKEFSLRRKSNKIDLQSHDLNFYKNKLLEAERQIQVLEIENEKFDNKANIAQQVIRKLQLQVDKLTEDLTNAEKEKLENLQNRNSLKKQNSIILTQIEPLREQNRYLIKKTRQLYDQIEANYNRNKNIKLTESPESIKSNEQINEIISDKKNLTIENDNLKQKIKILEQLKNKNQELQSSQQNLWQKEQEKKQLQGQLEFMERQNRVLRQKNKQLVVKQQELLILIEYQKSKIAEIEVQANNKFYESKQSQIQLQNFKRQKELTASKLTAVGSNLIEEQQQFMKIKSKLYQVQSYIKQIQENQSYERGKKDSQSQDNSNTQPLGDDREGEDDRSSKNKLDSQSKDIEVEQLRKQKDLLLLQLNQLNQLKILNQSLNQQIIKLDIIKNNLTKQLQQSEKTRKQQSSKHLQVVKEKEQLRQKIQKQQALSISLINQLQEQKMLAEELQAEKQNKYIPQILSLQNLLNDKQKQKTNQMSQLQLLRLQNYNYYTKLLESRNIIADNQKLLAENDDLKKQLQIIITKKTNEPVLVSQTSHTNLNTICEEQLFVHGNQSQSKIQTSIPIGGNAFEIQIKQKQPLKYIDILQKKLAEKYSTPKQTKDEQEGIDFFKKKLLQAEAYITELLKQKQQIMEAAQRLQQNIDNLHFEIEELNEKNEESEKDKQRILIDLKQMRGEKIDLLSNIAVLKESQEFQLTEFVKMKNIKEKIQNQLKFMSQTLQYTQNQYKQLLVENQMLKEVENQSKINMDKNQDISDENLNLLAEIENLKLQYDALSLNAQMNVKIYAAQKLKYEQQLSKLRQKEPNDNERLSQIQTENTRLQDLLKKKSEQLSDIQKINLELYTENKSLIDKQIQFSQKIVQFNQLKAIHKNLIQEFENLKVKQKNLLMEKQKLSQQIIRQNQQSQNKKVQMTTIKLQHDNLHVENEFMRKRLEDISLQSSAKQLSLNQRYVQLEDRLKDLRDEIQSKDHLIMQLQSQNTILKEHQEKLVTQLVEKTSISNEYQKRISEQIIKSNVNEKNSRQLKSILQKEIEQKDQLAQNLESIRNQLFDCKNNYSNAKQQIQHLTVNIEELQTQIKKERQLNNASKTQIDEFDYELKKKKSEISNSELLQRSLENIIKQAKLLEFKKDQEINELKQLLQQRQNNFDNLNKQIENESQVQELNCDTLLQQKQQHQKVNKDHKLEEQITDIDAKNPNSQKFKQILRDAEQDINNIDREDKKESDLILNLESEITNLTKQLQAKNKQINELIIRNHQIQNNLKQLKQQSEKLRENQDVNQELKESLVQAERINQQLQVKIRLLQQTGQLNNQRDITGQIIKQREDGSSQKVLFQNKEADRELSMEYEDNYTLQRQKQILEYKVKQLSQIQQKYQKSILLNAQNENRIMILQNQKKQLIEKLRSAEIRVYQTIELKDHIKIQEQQIVERDVQYDILNEENKILKTEYERLKECEDNKYGLLEGGVKKIIDIYENFKQDITYQPDFSKEAEYFPALNKLLNTILYRLKLSFAIQLEKNLKITKFQNQLQKKQSSLNEKTQRILEMNQQLQRYQKSENILNQRLEEALNEIVEESSTNKELKAQLQVIHEEFNRQKIKIKQYEKKVKIDENIYDKIDRNDKITQSQQILKAFLLKITQIEENVEEIKSEILLKHINENDYKISSKSSQAQRESDHVNIIERLQQLEQRLMKNANQIKQHQERSDIQLFDLLRDLIENNEEPQINKNKIQTYLNQLESQILRSQQIHQEQVDKLKNQINIIENEKEELLFKLGQEQEKHSMKQQNRIYLSNKEELLRQINNLNNIIQIYHQQSSRKQKIYKKQINDLLNDYRYLQEQYEKIMVGKGTPEQQKIRELIAQNTFNLQNIQKLESNQLDAQGTEFSVDDGYIEISQTKQIESQKKEEVQYLPISLHKKEKQNNKYEQIIESVEMKPFLAFLLNNKDLDKEDILLLKKKIAQIKNKQIEDNLEFLKTKSKKISELFSQQNLQNAQQQAENVIIHLANNCSKEEISQIFGSEDNDEILNKLEAFYLQIQESFYKTSNSNVLIKQIEDRKRKYYITPTKLSEQVFNNLINILIAKRDDQFYECNECLFKSLYEIQQGFESSLRKKDEVYRMHNQRMNKIFNRSSSDNSEEYLSAFEGNGEPDDLPIIKSEQKLRQNNEDEPSFQNQQFSDHQ